MLKFWTRELHRRLRRKAGGSGRPVGQTEEHRGLEWAAAILLGILLAGGIILLLQARLRPITAAVAQTQVENTVNQLVEEAVLAELSQREIGYSDLVTIQRDGAGTITALTTDMAAMNLLRGQLVECVLAQLKEVNVSGFQIPLGSLLDIDWLWGKGPQLKLYSMSVGTVSAEFESELSSAGVNQTMHRIWLEIQVPLTLILPGEQISTQVENRLCVAETVIVGQVPEAFFQTSGE